MKTEDGGIETISPALPPPPPPPSSSAFSNGTIDDAAANLAAQAKRTVCDHCRRRRIRCDGKLPCQPCVNASLACKRDHVPLKRGPKRGRGRVINELRERYSIDTGNSKHSRESSTDLANAGLPTVPSTSLSPPPPSDISWQNVSTDPRHAPEPGGTFSTEQYRPTTRSYIYLIPRCVELYYEHIYPIMPLPYMPALRAMVSRSPAMSHLSFSERSYLFALCALTCFHMSGQNITADAPTPSWECAGRFFLDECIAARQSYDFFGDPSLRAVMSSFWLSTSFFEINQSRKSWLYLREALTLAQELLLHDDSSYADLEPAERLCSQRVFWQLFVTERSFAVLRSKPITLKKAPSLPTARHSYETPEIHSGFLQLIGSYTPLDEPFVNAWNEGSDPRVTAATYLALQNLLALPPPFLDRRDPEVASRRHIASTTSPSCEERSLNSVNLSSSPDPFSDDATISDLALQMRPDVKTESENKPEPGKPETTDIQKADLLITQQWLRLIVWQSSFRQQLLSWTALDESMRFAFPLNIASRTAAIIQSLPAQAIEVHGMGIFEKIFEIGTWSMNVLQACDMAGAANTGFSGGGSAMGMDFVGASDLGVLGVGRLSYSVDPLEFFVRTLSASPNSRTQYAERLLMFANEQTGGMRMSLSPSLSSPPSPEFSYSSRWGKDEKPGTLNDTVGSAQGVASDGYAAACQPAEQSYLAAVSPTRVSGSDSYVSPSVSRNHSYSSFIEEMQASGTNVDYQNSHNNLPGSSNAANVGTVQTNFFQLSSLRNE
ncbi:fungal specific transcription factor domain-containing protein [Niveomyces insectorum RCEF 264]|uniref:Fungal specific transcription factor domain-containing protein n=1 Tax=Niveomyces insectorum RCEF 264 TaxID=1081102 RepID=A0A167P0F7_9HYPO|nr:fungal specific transcription factor domain-containing protein [Niveomyces insectorum RCEF 264]